MTLTPQERAENIALFELICNSPAEWYAKMASELQDAEQAGFRAGVEAARAVVYESDLDDDMVLDRKIRALLAQEDEHGS